MASTTSKADSADWPGRRLDHAEYGAKLAARRAELEAQGIEINMPRNSGANRTESKKALLKAIDEAAAKKGFKW